MFGCPAKKNTPTVDLSLNGIKKFIEYTKQFPVSSLSIGRPGARITVYQNLAAQDPVVVPEPPAGAQSAEAAADYPAESYEKIKSDTVGIFIPVKGIMAGAAVEKGRVVARISAMKLESDITAPRDCIIKEILAAANDQIEYGQPLFFIE